MSGICGIVNLDGAPIDRPLLEEMTAFMAFRGPDAQDVWTNAGVGFGHTLLRTTFESERERQPFSLDGKVWITADARIDGRDELRNKIAATGRARIEGGTDVELILHAYHAWGEDCLQRLIGDFAFAIWDGPQKRLFCARDHFGVKPFFYARIGPCLIFSNTLDCVRRHPAVSTTLNDLAIADFLLFDMNQDPGGTTFADIQRLPPAQYLIYSTGGLKLNRYWTLPANGGVQYRAAGEYVEHFKDLLEIAVGDRLRCDRIGIEMSGGLDSSAIAATALTLLSGRSGSFELNAHSIVYDRLIPDEERHYSGLVAAKLGIPIHYCIADKYKLYERGGLPETHFPEPLHDPLAAMSIDSFRQSAENGRVFLTGWDGDALLNESPKPYFRALLKDRKFARLFGGAVRYLVSQRRLVPLSVRTWLNGPGAGNERHVPAYPVWINPDLEKRLDLPSRWQQIHAKTAASHPIRPYAHQIFTYISAMSSFFDDYDAGSTRLPLEYRHPLMDLRLLDYCLALPPLPWCVKKEILRAAMRGVLPELVRLRPKTPRAGWPHLELLRQTDAQWVDQFVAAPETARYVDRGRIPRVWRETDPDTAWLNLRPLSLDFWIQGLRSPANQ